MTPAQSCRADRPTLELHQLKRVRQLLADLLGGNEFYSKRLLAAGAVTRPENLEDYVATVPPTCKEELAEDQAANPPYGTNLTYPIHRYTRFSQTSGTIGAPLRWLDTAESWKSMIDCWQRVFEAAGVSQQDRIFFPFSFGPFLGFWVAFEAATGMGCLAIPGGGMRSGARVRTILDNGVTVLCATPTYAIRLAEVAAEENIDLSASQVRRIIVAGEAGGGIPATREAIERMWPGAQVADHHGMTETGPVSYECPIRTGVLHIIESALFPEVIDPETGAPADSGELVLTNLTRTGSPLLRYRTRDMVRRGGSGACECGTHEMALEGGILGRTDDMVVVRGVNVYPSAVEQILRSSGGVAEFRVEVSGERTLPEMSVAIEPILHEDGEAVARRVEAALRNAFGLRVAVSAVEAGSLPRFEAKAKRWSRK